MSTAKTETEIKPLRIDSVALYRVCVPFVEPFRISNGSVAEKDVVLIELTTDRGVVGWGEASPMSGSFYSDDTPDSVWLTLKEKLIPLVLAEREIDATRFYERLREVAGQAFAKAGLEGALWDAHARNLNAPLCELFGANRTPIASGLAVGIFDTIEELTERVKRYVAEGYRRVKIKIQPGWDVEPVAHLRALFPGLPLMVDANAAYSLDDAEIFIKLDAYDLMMFEQPLARGAHADSAELQRQLRTPICADESAESLADVEEIIERDAARIVNIKIQRVGGLSEARLMLGQVRAAGLGCWLGTMPELGVGSAQGLHFAALEGLNHPTDIEASARWFVDDIIEPKITIDRDGFIHAPAGAGIGFEVSREKVARYAIASEEFRA
ncbi:MAG TPA: o-succinylbenzoate synthase [Pyrinomonadaceae bacterium]|nr:o-succinylbenzoate synthase [Pyrinomonadaceae bacterium]